MMVSDIPIPITLKGVLHVPEPGFERVDELADLLGVSPGPGDIQIIGKSGNAYPLADLVLAHVRLMLGDTTDVREPRRRVHDPELPVSFWRLRHALFEYLIVSEGCRWTRRPIGRRVFQGLGRWARQAR